MRGRVFSPTVGAVTWRGKLSLLLTSHLYPRGTGVLRCPEENLVSGLQKSGLLSGSDSPLNPKDSGEEPTEQGSLDSPAAIGY